MTTAYLSSNNFPSVFSVSADTLAGELETLLISDFTGDMYALPAGFQQILADNRHRHQWPVVHKKLETLFKCGKNAVVDGPMIGIPVSIGDSDYFQETVQHCGKERSKIASIEWRKFGTLPDFQRSNMPLKKTGGNAPMTQPAA